jgi:hypothetical protein
VGALGAIAILYKIIFIAPLASTFLALLAIAWLNRRQPDAWKTLFIRSAMIAVGLVTPIALVFGYFASLGLWDRFMLIFKLGTSYLGNSNVMLLSWLPKPFGFPLFWMGFNNFPLLALGLFATYRLIRQSIPIKNSDNVIHMSLAAWLITSFALAGMRGGGFAYYVLPLIPPLAFMAAIEINTAYEFWAKRSSPFHALTITGTMVALVLFSFLWINYAPYQKYLLIKLGRSQETFIYKSDEANYNLAEYIKSHTTSDDFIYIWGKSVDLYYYADRLPPIDILWPVYVGATGSPDRIFDSRTKYIILEDPADAETHQWLLDGLKTYYELETVLDGREIYKRKSP